MPVAKKKTKKRRVMAPKSFTLDEREWCELYRYLCAEAERSQDDLNESQALRKAIRELLEIKRKQHR